LKFTSEVADPSVDTTPYTPVYSFEFSESTDEAMGANAEREETTPFQSRLSIAVPPPRLSILLLVDHIPLGQCLYLWHCGTLRAGREYYNYRVYSATCLWIWKCGWRRRHD
jgi:hypothetical protein